MAWGNDVQFVWSYVRACEARDVVVYLVHVHLRRGTRASAGGAADGTRLKGGVVKRPGRSPEWTDRTLKDSAQLRDFLADLKKKLASWSDRDE